MEPVVVSQQPPSEPHKQRALYLLIILVILAGITSYFGYQNWQLRSDTNKVITTTEPTPIEQSWSVTPQISQSIQVITNQLLSNTLQLTSTNSGVPMFTKEFDLSQNNGWANYVVTVYKYSPGAKLEEVG